MDMVNLACIVSILSLLVVGIQARIPGVYSGGAWQNAHATFYGGSDASGTMGMYPFLAHCIYPFQFYLALYFSGKQSKSLLIFLIQIRLISACFVLFWFGIQVERVVMVTFTAKDMEWTLQLWVRRSLIMDLAVEHVLRSSVLMNHNGAIQGVLPSSLLQLTFVPQISLCLMITAVGVILLALISTSLCLCSSGSPSTAPASFPSLSAGN